ncbi:MAG: hypothetical protein JWM95_1705 [Gemmatimonadetes bacterium]|nr:hypothetical protein [Gemmatimonadota bacterium]
MPVWLVGQVRGHGQWEVQGVFSSEDKAVAACRNQWHFVMPLELDAELPDQTTTELPAGTYYPRASV